MRSLIPKRRRRQAAAVLACAGVLAGCAQMGYLAQAAHGQFALLSDARPIDDWLQDSSAAPALKQRLEAAKEIRRYAVAELGLPDNSSYKNYAALSRPYALWNVVATPELSLKPMQWCFPIAGCVSYRGYYSKDDAEAFAKQLRAEGDDVQVGGVTAYSTLGWFNDPLLSTFINYPDAELARLLFHELAHQVVYVSGDTQFNESFATAVEEAGVQRWLATHGDAAMRERYAQYNRRKQDFLNLLLSARHALEANYASNADDAHKRAEKLRVFRQLQDDYQTLKRSWGGYAGYDRWFADPLTNAHLAAVAAYNDYVPAFRALLARSAGFPAFYEAVRRLSRLDRPERERELRQLQATTAS